MYQMRHILQKTSKQNKNKSQSYFTGNENFEIKMLLIHQPNMSIHDCPKNFTHLVETAMSGHELYVTMFQIQAEKDCFDPTALFRGPYFIPAPLWFQILFIRLTKNSDQNYSILLDFFEGTFTPMNFLGMTPAFLLLAHAKKDALSDLIFQKLIFRVPKDTKAFRETFENRVSAGDFDTPSASRFKAMIKANPLFNP